MTRHDLNSLRALYDRPFFDLMAQARATYHAHRPEHGVQLCTLFLLPRLLETTEQKRLFEPFLKQA